MKIKKSAIAMFIVSIIVILCATAVAISMWRSHMAFNIDSSTSYIINEANFTDPVNYQIITDTYLLGFIFAFFGILGGSFISAGLWVIYGIVLLIIYIVKHAKKSKADAKTIKELKKE